MNAAARYLAFLPVLLLLPAGEAPARDPAAWAVGDVDLPTVEAFRQGVLEAVEKAAPRAPAWKPGAEARLLVVASDAGARATLVDSTVDPKLLPELEEWTRRWILPVGEPGMAMPVRVRWDKPGSGEKKEKVPKGGTPTRPPPGLRVEVGYLVAATGPVAADEVVRAAGLVFSSEERCLSEVEAMRVGTLATMLWHMEIASDGAVRAIPQDLHVPPAEAGGKGGKQAADAAKAPKAEAPKMEAPKMEAPKMEAPKTPKVEVPGGVAVPEAAGGAEAAAPPREWTALESCVAARLAESRVRTAPSSQATLLDDFPVVVRRP